MAQSPCPATAIVFQIAGTPRNRTTTMSAPLDLPSSTSVPSQPPPRAMLLTQINNVVHYSRSEFRPATPNPENTPRASNRTVRNSLCPNALRTPVFHRPENHLKSAPYTHLEKRRGCTPLLPEMEL